MSYLSDKLGELIFNPNPVRALATKVCRKFKIGSYERRLKLGAVEKPWYGYMVYHAACLAKKLQHKRISVLEFGVAGGNGLLNLEAHAQEITKLLDVEIDIYGFDTGKGLPEPTDFRDLPYHWRGGFYEMDETKLKRKLNSAQLVLGDIKETAKGFFEAYQPAPIGAVAYDFDYYSSTVHALKMLEADDQFFLPRVFSYFDDIIGSEIELYNDNTGERLAINEFNDTHSDVKICPAYHLLGQQPAESWHPKIWISHFYRHPRYNDFVSLENQQSPC